MRNFKLLTKARYCGYILLAAGIFFIGWYAGKEHTYNKIQWCGCYGISSIGGSYYALGGKFERTDSLVANNWIIYMTIKYDGESINYYYDKKFVR